MDGPGGGPPEHHVEPEKILPDELDHVAHRCGRVWRASTRGKILSLREEDYVVAARLSGSSHMRVIFRICCLPL
jgi:hypothetical protein